jgi:hypothetical protein
VNIKEMSCLLSSDIIRETVMFLQGQDLPMCCLVCPAWAETIMPLIQFTIYQNLQTCSCSQQLFYERDMGAMINVSLLNEGGSYISLASGVDGNGKLMICDTTGASSSTPTDASASSSSQELKLDRAATTLTTLNLPTQDQKIIGFTQVSSHIYGFSVGETLGFGSMLYKWSFNGEVVQQLNLEYSDTISGSGKSYVGIVY